MRTMALLMVVLLVAACGPRYRTEYHYFPPDYEEGRGCVAKCRGAVKRCGAEAHKVSESDYEKCSERAYAEYTHCKTYTKGLCYRPVCVLTPENTPQYKNCEQEYKNCFEDCGGRVDVHEVCEANCR